jgi:signal transduction histidine kinase
LRESLKHWQNALPDMMESHVHVTGERSAALLEVGDVLEIGVLSLDQSLTITGWNAWLESATGKRAADVIGCPLVDVEPDLRPASRTALEQAVNGATVMLSQRLHGYLLAIQPPAGFESVGQMQQSVRILPMFTELGAPCGAVAFIQDVTERVAHEKELQVAMEMAQTANRAKSNFLAAMTHELRTPIGAMSSYADLLAGGLFGEVTETQRTQLLRIKGIASHLLGIVEQILTAARVEAGREQLTLCDADGVQLVREALLAIEPMAAEKGLQLTAQLPSTPIPMRTDAVKVRQIVINLLGNAVKFTRRGSISISVDQPDESRIAMHIADTGPGIAEEDIERIFEPFVQVHRTANRPYEGTGLGLSVSRGIARLLGGDVVVTSEAGAGSTFTAILPLATAG